MAGILGAAIALIVLLALPSAASAHPGHHDRDSRATTAEVEPALSRSIAKAEKVTAELRRVTANDNTKSPPCGDLSCCEKASCAACCVVIVGTTAMVEPVWAALPRPMADSPAPSGTGPGDLSRPPRSLALI